MEMALVKSRDEASKLKNDLAKSRDEVAELKKKLAEAESRASDGADNATASNQFFKPPTNKTCHKNYEPPKEVKLGDGGGDLLYIPTKVAEKLYNLNRENMFRVQDGSAVMHTSDDNKTIYCSEKQKAVLVTLMDMTIRHLQERKSTTNFMHYVAMEREFFYCLKKLVVKQEDLKKYFEVIGKICNVPVASLACRAGPKGRYMGRIVITRNGKAFNAADETILANNPFGFDPPHDIILFHLGCLENRDDITLISDARVIILVEDYG